MSEFGGYNEKYAIGRAMEKYGGSFMSGIGIALQHADRQNTAKIKATWPEEWAQYRQMAVRMFSDKDEDVY